jgi:hypothetical protein
MPKLSHTHPQPRTTLEYLVGFGYQAFDMLPQLHPSIMEDLNGQGIFLFEGHCTW